MKTLCTLIILPVAFVIAIFTAQSMRSSEDSKRIELRLQEIGNRGIAVEDRQAESAFLSQTTKENWIRWYEAVHLAAAGYRTEDLQLFAPDGWPQNLPFNDEQMRITQEHLRRFAPLLNEVQALPQPERPIYAPIEIDGLATSLDFLNQVRQLLVLLQLQAEHALHEEDNEQALATLVTMSKVTEAYDWKMWSVARYIHSSMVANLHQSICRAVAERRWDQGELQALAQLIDDSPDLPTTWPDCVDAVTAVTLLALRDTRRMSYAVGENAQTLHSYAVPPSKQIEVLQRLDDWRALPTGSFPELWAAALHLQDETQSQSTAWSLPQINRDNLMFSAYGMLRSQVLGESLRRMTLLSLALREHQAKNGSWPDALEDLQSDLLSTNCKFAADGQPFIYENSRGEVRLSFTIEGPGTEANVPNLSLLAANSPQSFFMTSNAILVRLQD